MLHVSTLRWAALVLLLPIFVWLRWDVHPKTYFADELIPRAVVKHMQDTQTLDTNWENADWRIDYAGGFYKLQQYNFSSYHVALFALRKLAAVVHADVQPDLVFYRLTSLFFQLFTLLLVYAVAEQLAGYLGGTLAAAFFTVMPQAVVDAHYARPESFVMLLVMLVVWLALRALQTHNVRHDVMAAGVWGVAFACKFSFAPMALLALLQCLHKKFSTISILMWLAAFIGGAFLSAPRLVLDPAGFLHGVRLLLTQYGQPDVTSGFVNTYLPSAHELFLYLVDFLGWPLMLLLLASLWVKSAVPRCFAWIGMLVTVIYVSMFSHAGVFFERNLSHLLPLWSVSAAMGVQALLLGSDVSSSRQYLRCALVCGLVVVALGYAANLSYRIVSVVFHDDGRLQQRVVEHDGKMLEKYHGHRVLPVKPSINLSVVDALPENVLVRMAAVEPTFQPAVRVMLQAHGYRFLESFSMPLGDLAYNQLQINHVPSAYDYYGRVNP